MLDSPPPASAPVPDIFGHAFQIRTKERLLRDPVHGLIPIDENTEHGRLLVRLIDSAEMQRLRRIRQLGLAHYAFQGAEHSRFAHSVGAFHVLRGIVGQLERMYAIDSELAFYAAVAALLHDLGHGPFSHLAERALGIEHEHWTVELLHDPDTEVHRALSSYSRRLPSIIESVLTGRAKPGYLSSLVNSELDADRLDYLQRDSLMTGVKYGIHDVDRLVHMMRISPEGDKIVVARGGLVPVEKYIQARYHMHRQVYRHKTVIAAEAMLGAALDRARRLLREGRPEAAGLRATDVLARALTDPRSLSARDYLELDDVEILAWTKARARGEDPVLADLASRVLHRRLFKTIEFDASRPDIEERLREAADAVRGAGLDPAHYLLRVESVDVPYRPYAPDRDRVNRQILIESDGGRIVDVAALSPTIEVFTRTDFHAARVVLPAEHAGTDLRARVGEILGAPRRA